MPKTCSKPEQKEKDRKEKKHSKEKSHRSRSGTNKTSAASQKVLDDQDEWVEKEPSHLEPVTNDDESTGTGGQDKDHPKPQRDPWMVSREEQQPKQDNSDSQPQGSKDYLDSFGSIVSSRKAREKAEQQKANEPETSKHASSSIKRLGADDPDYQPNAPANSISPATPSFVPGGPGYQWRMTKLKRTYDTAREENRPIEEVALERYGTLEAWNQAIKEREYVEERQNNLDSRSGRSTPRQQDSRYVFTNREEHSFSSSGISRPNSRSGFRRPNSAFNTPEGTRLGASVNRRLDEIRSQAQVQSSTTANPISSASSSVASTPLPYVIDPLAAARASSVTSASKNTTSPSNSTTALNKLQASILKAQIMDPKSVPELQKQYNELKLSLEYKNNYSSDLDKIQLVPTLDGRGKMYDVGNGVESDAPVNQGNNKRKKQEKFETRDPKTGELLRINPDDDKISLSEMVRQERLQAGSADQKSLDVEMATRIMGDHKFQNDLDYMDDNADQLARKKMKTDASKRLFAINDYKRTQKALETCQFCFKDDGNPPSNLGIISTGTKVYLSCTQFEELVDGHCLIAPMQHALCSLELDDDVWDEIKNYMKCLMRMFSEKHDKGVVFYETVLSFKHQSHTYIEAVPIPWDLFNDIPAYFRESINSCESEWSQHRKLINFSDRPGGFRRSMVSKLPYFMVQWDYKGEKGFGHVIEGNDNDPSTSSGRGTAVGEVDELNVNMDDGLKGGKFPRYFAAEIIGNLLELEPSKWRRPRRITGNGNNTKHYQHHNHKHKNNFNTSNDTNLSSVNNDRVKNFLNHVGFSKFDWTSLL